MAPSDKRETCEVIRKPCNKSCGRYLSSWKFFPTSFPCLSQGDRWGNTFGWWKVSREGYKPSHRFCFLSCPRTPPTGTVCVHPDTCSGACTAPGRPVGRPSKHGRRSLARSLAGGQGNNTLAQRISPPRDLS